MVKLDSIIFVNKKKVRLYSFHDINKNYEGNIDIFVEVEGFTYGGQIYSHRNVLEMMEQSGLPTYFYDRNGVVIQYLNLESITNTVRELVENEELERAFSLQI